MTDPAPLLAEKVAGIDEEQQGELSRPERELSRRLISAPGISHFDDELEYWREAFRRD